ncbi:unnamed protein product [Chrysoparadoxa australica]
MRSQLSILLCVCLLSKLCQGFMLTASLLIDIVRHGETTANRDGIIQGHSNYDLTDSGVEQALAVAERLSSTKYNKVYSSDLIRASRTAETIVSALNASGEQSHTCHLEANLREFALGVFENLPRGTSLEDAQQIKAADKTLGHAPLHEKPGDVEARAKQFLRHLMDDPDLATKPPSRCLVVSHGGFIRTMLSSVMGCKEVRSLSNCSVSRVQVTKCEAGKLSYEILSIDDTSHLTAEQITTCGTKIENITMK